MKQRKPLVIAVLTIAFIGLAVWQWRAAFTIVPIEEIEQAEQSEAFDPVAYVDAIWESRVIPTIMEDAVDLSTVLSDIETDDRGFAAKDQLIQVANRYGLITVGEAHVYMVKGRGRVIAVDTTSRPAAFEIALENYTGPIKVKIYLGPRLPSDDTSVRDSVGFINFGDFREQTEYGKVGAEMNKRVSQQVLSGLDAERLEGNTVSFHGAFTIRTFNLVEIDLNQIFVVPVRIEVE